MKTAHVLLILFCLIATPARAAISDQKLITITDCNNIGKILKQITQVSETLSNIESGHIQRFGLDAEWSNSEILDSNVTGLLSSLNGMLTAMTIASNVVAPIDQSIAYANVWIQANNAQQFQDALKQSIEKLSGATNNQALLGQLQKLGDIQKGTESVLQVIKSSTEKSFVVWNNEHPSRSLSRVIRQTQEATSDLLPPDLSSTKTEVQ